MRIERMKISELNTAAYNPRLQLMSDMPEFKRLKQSITEFGNVEPIVFNIRTGNVVGGNQRLAVLRDMGVTETDVSLVDMPIEQEKLLNVALNKIKGDWDYDKLPELLKEFNIEEAKLSGFSPQELAVLCADVNAAVDDFEDEAIFTEEYEAQQETQRIENLRESDFIPKRPEDNIVNTKSERHTEPTYSPTFEVETYLISLIFYNSAHALDWLNAHGWGKQYKQGTRSTVIKIE